MANPTDGAKYTLVVQQDAGGTNTLDIDAAVYWEGGDAPVITAAGDSIDVISLVYVAALSGYVGGYIQDLQLP